MRQTFKYTFAGALLVVVALLFAMTFGPSTEDLIMFSMPRSHASKMRAPAFWVLRNVRGLGGYRYQIPPLTFAVGACQERLEKDAWCTEVMDWMIQSGQNVDEEIHESMRLVANPQLGMRPLIASIFACSPKTVEYFLNKKADPNIKATQGKLKGMTPLEINNGIEMCKEAPQIAEVLKAHGAH